MLPPKTITVCVWRAGPSVQAGRALCHPTAQLLWYNGPCGLAGLLTSVIDSVGLGVLGTQGAATSSPARFNHVCWWPCGHRCRLMIYVSVVPRYLFAAVCQKATLAGLRVSRAEVPDQAAARMCAHVGVLRRHPSSWLHTHCKCVHGCAGNCTDLVATSFTSGNVCSAHLLLSTY